MLVMLQLLCGSVDASATEMPQWYLVGSMNGWITPDDGGTDFPLKDEDGDVVYTGTYNLEPGSEFKVFTKICGWSGDDDGPNENVYGLADLAKTIFSNRENLFCLKTGYDAASMQLIGDGSGPVTISCSLRDGSPGLMDMTVTAPEWSKAPETPDKIYVIGDFNDWKFPTAADLNGALEFNAEDWLDPGNFLVSYNSKGGDEANVALVYPCNRNYGSFKVIPPLYTVPATIMNKPDGRLAYYKMESYTEQIVTARRGIEKDELKFRFRDCHDGEIVFSIDTANRDYEYYCRNASAIETNPALYAVVAVDGKGPVVHELLGDGMMASFLKQGPQDISFETEGKTISYFFTSEKSAAPSDDNIWGDGGYDTSYDDTGHAYYCLSKGGEPITRRFEGRSRVRLSVNFYSNVVTEYSELTEEALQCIYLVGYQNDWQSPVYANESDLIKLVRVADGVFEADVECPYVEGAEGGDFSSMMFRFYSRLDGWSNTYSFGSDLPDFYSVDVDMSKSPVKSPIVRRGLGNWGLANWKGGKVRMRVDLMNYELTLTDLHSAVDCVDADMHGRQVEYYSLQGVKMGNPGSGVVIRRSNGKAEKVAVR